MRRQRRDDHQADQGDLVGREELLCRGPAGYIIGMSFALETSCEDGPLWGAIVFL